jgi:uncharacterized protein YggU (UPF0235/DUF167 family)
MDASTRLELRVVPGASGTGVVGRYGDAWKIRVAARPEKGRANDAVVALLADTLGMPRQDVSIVAGLGTRDKVLSLRGISAPELDRRLAVAVGEVRS